MTREEARKAAEVMIAYADGKEIEVKTINGEWHKETRPTFNWTAKTYRIKPTPTYRPFANAEECWEEMKKHEPFGWLKEKGKNKYVNVKRIDGEFMSVLLGGDDNWGMKGAFNNYIFADGSVFGKLTGEEE